MATYIVQTTINPGVSYEVDEAEFQQLKDLGILLNNNPEPLAGVFDREVAALVVNVNSQTYDRLTKLPLTPHTHLTTEIADSGSTGRALLKTTSALDARTLIGALAASAAGAASGVAQLDSNTRVPVAQLPVGLASGVASLDSGGKIPQSQLPAIALQEFLGAVADQASMLALSGQRGDWATRTDRGTDFQLIAEPSTTLANWRERTYPASPVLSVDGRVGAVTLGATAATASELARRGTGGTLLVATATQPSEATTLAQTQALLTTFGRGRGTGTTLPSTDLRQGDFFYHTGFACGFEYNNSAWRQADIPVVADNTARAALPTAGRYAGFKIWHTALACEEIWDGTAWRFRLFGSGTFSTDANGAASLPHGGGQTPRSIPVIGMGFPQNESQAQVQKVIATTVDGTNLYFKWYRTDQSTSFNNPGLYVTWACDF